MQVRSLTTNFKPGRGALLEEESIQLDRLSIALDFPLPVNRKSGEYDRNHLLHIEVSVHRVAEYGRVSFSQESRDFRSAFLSPTVGERLCAINIPMCASAT